VFARVSPAGKRDGSVAQRPGFPADHPDTPISVEKALKKRKVKPNKATKEAAKG